ncbi:unnamed protein product [Prunus brigantina]
MERRCTAQGLKESKQLQFTLGWKPVDDVVEEGWKLEKDVELVPLNPDQPDKEAQIGSPKNPKKKDREEGIHPEGSLEEGWKPEEDVDLVPLDPDQPNKEARIGSRLSPDEKMEMTIFLQNNKDMFAWSPSDMPGIDPNIVCHRLRVNHASKPVVQKRRNFAFGMAGQHCSGIETRKGKIDQLVDSTSGNQLLSFMDAYSGYNQIMMYDDDKVKTSFIIERGTYYYKVMPFGLKNAGATYHRLVNKIFTDRIGENHGSLRRRYAGQSPQACRPPQKPHRGIQPAPPVSHEAEPK